MARPTDLLGRPLGNGLELPRLMAELAHHYLERALTEADGNKTRAAELVGLPSYQTFTNWMNRYGLTPPCGRPPAMMARTLLGEYDDAG